MLRAAVYLPGVRGNTRKFKRVASIRYTLDHLSCRIGSNAESSETHVCYEQIFCAYPTFRKCLVVRSRRLKRVERQHKPAVFCHPHDAAHIFLAGKRICQHYGLPKLRQHLRFVERPCQKAVRTTFELQRGYIDALMCLCHRKKLFLMLAAKLRNVAQIAFKYIHVHQERRRRQFVDIHFASPFLLDYSIRRSAFTKSLCKIYIFLFLCGIIMLG